MRIGVVCAAFGELSESFVTNEVRALRRAGHEVTVLAFDEPGHRHLPADCPAPELVLSRALPRREASGARRRPRREPGGVCP